MATYNTKSPQGGYIFMHMNYKFFTDVGEHPRVMRTAKPAFTATVLPAYEQAPRLSSNVFQVGDKYFKIVLDDLIHTDALESKITWALNDASNKYVFVMSKFKK